MGWAKRSGNLATWQLRVSHNIYLLFAVVVVVVGGAVKGHSSDRRRGREAGGGVYEMGAEYQQPVE